jgi:hypothetical protein
VFPPNLTPRPANADGGNPCRSDSASAAAWRRRLRRAGGTEEQQVRVATEWIAEIASRFPRPRARADEQQGDDEAFEFGLQTVLDGLEARLARR